MIRNKLYLSKDTSKLNKRLTIFLFSPPKICCKILKNQTLFLNFMNDTKATEFCLIVEGSYFTVEEAKHALCDPFIEDFVEQTGRFRIQNFEDIQVVTGISLGDLEIGEIDDGVYEISCRTSPLILNRRKADLLAETLRRQAMFDEISIEPLV